MHKQNGLKDRNQALYQLVQVITGSEKWGNPRKSEKRPRRDGKVYVLYNRGFSQSRIAETFHVSQQLISHDLKLMKVKDENRSMGEDLKALQRTKNVAINQHRDLLSEAWTIYSELEGASKEARIEMMSRLKALNNIQKTLMPLAKIGLPRKSPPTAFRFPKDERIFPY